MIKVEDITASVEYEHSRGGKLISRGRTITDKHGLVHSIQTDDRGRKIAEAIFTPAGEIVSCEVYKIGFFERLLSLFQRR